MREILFKAKRIDNGEWVEGYFVKLLKDMCYIIDKDTFSHHLVDENTLCQYTGMTDKNGFRIWANDVVRLDEDIYIVTWEEADAMFALEDVGVIEHFDNADSKWCEVIGNTFDNTELMKGE